MRVTCARCASEFDARSKRARFCSPKCRLEAHQARSKGEPELAPVAAKPKRKPRKKAEPIGGTLAAVTAELSAVGRLESSAGQAAVALARRIDEGAESSSGLAALTREMRAAMAEALARVEATGDALDELRARREARRAG